MKVSHGSSDEQTVVSVFTHVYRSRIRTPGTRVGCGVVSYLYSAQLRLFSVCVRMVGEGTAAPPTGAAMSLGFRFVLSYIYVFIRFRCLRIYASVLLFARFPHSPARRERHIYTIPRLEGSSERARSESIRYTPTEYNRTCYLIFVFRTCPALFFRATYSLKTEPATPYRCGETGRPPSSGPLGGLSTPTTETAPPPPRSTRRCPTTS